MAPRAIRIVVAAQRRPARRGDHEPNRLGEDENNLDPYAYLRGVLERLPAHPASRIAELLPHRWRPASTDT